MKQSFLLFLAIICCANLFSQQRFEIKAGAFMLDGKNIQLICGEMHYPRIAKAYWQDRLKRAKAMGLNTISTYVFWNFHEWTPGVFDFKGQTDLGEFIRLAQKEGLYVILRSGPYVCAEWDFGGCPWWLLEEERMVFRSNDRRFLEACNGYISRLGKELSGLTIENEGPILMVQVENEYGSYSNDKVYLGKLCDMIKNAGFNVPLITCDSGGQMEAGHVEGTFPTINGVVGEDIFTIVDKFSPGGPYFVAELYSAWFDVWSNPYPKYHAFREMIQKYLPQGETLPDIPAPNKTISFPAVTLTETAALSESFTKRVKSDKILIMEDLGQDFGYIHYETTLKECVKGTLQIKDVRDYAVVLLNGEQIGSFDRRHRQSKIDIDVETVPAKLEILVENVGRVNYGPDILNNHKGITEKVTINDQEINGWIISPLPLYKAKVGSYKFFGLNFFNKLTDRHEGILPVLHLI